MTQPLLQPQLNNTIDVYLLLVLLSSSYFLNLSIILFEDSGLEILPNNKLIMRMINFFVIIMHKQASMIVQTPVSLF